MKLHASIISLLLIINSVRASNDSDALLLKSGTVFPKNNISEFINEKISPSEIVDGYYFRIIQFENFPTEDEKKAIHASGILLNMYLPYHAYSCAIPASFDRARLTGLKAKSVIRWERLTKLESELAGSVYPKHAEVERGKLDLIVHYHQNILQERAISLFMQSGISVIDTSEEIQAVTVRVPVSGLQRLTDLPFVYYVEPISPPSTKDDTEGKSQHRSNVLNSNLASGRHYDGSNVVVGLADDGTIGPHIDFTGRLTQHLTYDSGNHGDMTSGICMGAGNLIAKIKGMGTGAYLHLFTINGYPQIVDAVNNYNNYGIVITSTSYSEGCNAYTANSRSGDNLIFNNPQLSFCFSAGNDGTTDCGYGAGTQWGNITGGYKMGKNVVTVGNLENTDLLVTSSSRGPASDGRIKPDICANGGSQRSTNSNNTFQVGGGTSAACPGVAGTFTQLYQAYKELTGQPNPPSALIKACVLNTGEDLGNAGPDFKFGWGRINAFRAVRILEQQQYLSDSVTQGQTKTHVIVVPPNTRQLRLMLYWSDPGGSPGAAKALVNDLNLQVSDTSSNIFNPWILNSAHNATALDIPAFRGIDSLNNMEQVTIDSPAVGNYTVTVEGFQVPLSAVKYFIVYEFVVDSITVTFPMGGEAFVPINIEMIRWDAFGDSGTFDIRYSRDNGANWLPVTSGLPGYSRHFNWLVPVFVSDEVLVEVSRNGLSDTNDSVITVIQQPGNFRVTSACPDSIRLSWSAVTGATGYDVFMLGNKYMDYVGTTTALSYLVTNTDPTLDYWFSVRALGPNGGKGNRANAINKRPGISNCQLSIDGGITLLYPDTGVIKDCQHNGSIPVSVSIYNTGINTLSNFDVNYSLNGGTAVTETFTGSLATGASSVFTFANTLSVTTPGNNAFRIWITVGGDQYPHDDTISINLRLITGAAPTVPLTETFESYALCPTTSNCETTSCAIGGGWTNTINGAEDDIDWRVSQGSTPTANTGPSIDHTNGSSTGNYIYLESSVCFSRDARLNSPCFDLSSIATPMLTFWYHMDGATMGDLHIDIIGENQVFRDFHPVRSGDQGSFWKKDSVDLISFSGQSIVVRFRGITGGDDLSDMALDDISIVDRTIGIDEFDGAGELNFFPNPGNGIFNFVLTGAKANNYVLKVNDVLGQPVLEKTISGNAGGLNGSIDLSAQPNGIYIVTLQSEKISRQVRLMKMN